MAIQKKSSRASEQDRPDVARQRRDWQECQEHVDPDRLVFLDETGLKTDLTRLRGWSLGGERLVEAIPSGKWHVSTLVQAIALDGTRAAMVLDGPMNGDCFTGFCEWLLAPSLRPGDLVVMDNLSSHRNTAAVRAIESVGAQAIYLPPYSPDLNPIEMIFSKVKQLFRALRPRSFGQIIDDASDVLSKVTLNDIAAVFQHCGYDGT